MSILKTILENELSDHVTIEEFQQAFETVADVANQRVLKGELSPLSWWISELKVEVLSNRLVKAV